MHTPPEDADSACFSSTPTLPPPPRPSADAGMNAEGILPTPASQTTINLDDVNIFTMAPMTALKLLCDSVEHLVLLTGDIPPTPPVSNPTTPTSHAYAAEKRGGHRVPSPEDDDAAQRDADGQRITKTPIGSPEAHPHEPIHIAAPSTPLPPYFQHGALTRKFYSKSPPPIAIEEYLLRLHKYCPMSTAVYLAAALYIYRLAVTERLMPVTARNAHRLLLASLRVAMKALEDLSYPHPRFARVGGVSPAELGRLEVSFCFLTDFDLVASAADLARHATMLQSDAALPVLPPPAWAPVLPARKRMSRTLTPAELASAMLAPAVS